MPPSTRSRKEDVASVAIGLLHAYANPAHEQAIAERLAAKLPGVSVTLASQVCPEIREYERLSTAVANAYVRPLMAGYLNDLQARLAQAGSQGTLLLMTSGGGLTTAATAAEFPIRLVESGPAGGAILAASHARRSELNRVLAFDMGGTTAKLTLIDDYEPLLSRAFEIDRQYRFKKGSGLPVRIPVIEMVEIGAGGGSIASRDALQRICVGPRSAGSQPGPACYGLGGNEPAVTDADLQLGRLLAENFAGGQMQLDLAAARSALQTHLQTQTQGSQPASDSDRATELAWGVSEVVDENMAAAAKAHAAEWGKDVAGRTLIAFGGAAPLHAARLARKLGLRKIIIPAGAGVGSAIGFLAAPVSFEVVRSHYLRLNEFEPELLQELTASMHAEALRVIEPAISTDQQDLIVRRRVFMRYAGQGYEISVEMNAPDESQGWTREVLRERFEQAYEKLYTRSIPGLDIEILSWTLSLADRQSGELPAGALRALGEPRTDQTAGSSNGQVFDPETESMVAATIVRRAELQVDTILSGPALIVEAQTTSFVPGGAQACVSAAGDLVIEYV